MLVQFIVLTGVIGSGIFVSNGSALQIAGPAGLLLAVFVMGVIGVLVMETLSELVQLFPAPNAIVQYVQAFVDVDWGWAVGLAYWYVHSKDSLANISAHKLKGIHMLPHLLFRTSPLRNSSDIGEFRMEIGDLSSSSTSSSLSSYWVLTLLACL